MAARALLFVVLLQPLAAAASEHTRPAAEQVAAQAIHFFTRDDLGSLDGPLVGMLDLRKTLDKLDCITLHHVEWNVLFETSDRLHLRLDLDATGVTKADWHPERRLPRIWLVDAERRGEEWKIVRVVSAERATGQAMAAAATLDDAECFFETTAGVSLEETVVAYADELDQARKTASMLHAAQLARTLASPVAEALVVRNEARLLGRTNHPDALATARRALELAKRGNSLDAVMEATFSIAVAHMFRSEDGEAMDAFAKVAKSIALLDDPILAMKAMHMHAWLAGHAGKVLLVLRGSERLTELARHYDWREGEIGALFSSASVHWLLGNLSHAADDYREARRLSLLNADRTLAAFNSHNLAVLAIMEKDYPAAEVLIQDAVSLMDDTQKDKMAIVYLSLAQALTKGGRYEEAEEAIERATGMLAEVPREDKVPGTSALLTTAALRVAQGRAEEAIAAAREAVSTQHNQAMEDTARLESEAFAVLGQALRLAGRQEEAIAAFRSSLAIDENHRYTIAAGLGIAAAANEHLPVHLELVELLVERNEHEEAFRVAEQLKARALRDALQRGQVDLSPTMTAEERERQAELEKRHATANRAYLAAAQEQRPLEALRSAKDEARAELDRFRTEMRVLHPVLARRWSDDVETIALPETDEPVTVVEYVVTGKQTMAFVLTKDVLGATRLEAVTIPVGQEAIDRQARELAEAMASRSLGYRAAAQRMYASLLAPLERLLKGKKTICIIPDGALWTVPFHALVTRDGKYVVDRHAIFYASSLALLRTSAGRPAEARSRLIAFGNPSVGSNAQATVRSAFRDITLGSLIDAEKEALSVSKMYGEGARAYVREDARETVFKDEADDFGIVHIAAHAFVDDRAPMYSAIVLAATGEDMLEDGLLEAREVADLPLKAELAVLSACDTARGQVGSGEGVIGIAWAFLAAGCPTLIVSQWQAESRATADLMIEFHRQLRNGATTAAALRAAQMAVRKKNPHPFYWAPFVAMGAGGKSVSAAR